MADGYQIAFAIESICVGESHGSADHDALHGKTWYPTDRTSVQELLAVAISGGCENSRIATLELRDRILACAAMQSQINERAADLLREQERHICRMREEWEGEQ